MTRDVHLAQATYDGYHGYAPTAEQLSSRTLRNSHHQGVRARLEGRGCGCPACDGRPVEESEA